MNLQFLVKMEFERSALLDRFNGVPQSAACPAAPRSVACEGKWQSAGLCSDRSPVRTASRGTLTTSALDEPVGGPEGRPCLTSGLQNPKRGGGRRAETLPNFPPYFSFFF